MLCIVVFVAHLICKISNKSYFNLLHFYFIFLINRNRDRTIFKKFFIYCLIIFVVLKNARTSIASIDVNYFFIFLI